MTDAEAFDFRRTSGGACRGSPFSLRHNPTTRSARREFICLVGGRHAKATENLLVTNYQPTFKLFKLNLSINLVPTLRWRQPRESYHVLYLIC